MRLLDGSQGRPGVASGYRWHSGFETLLGAAAFLLSAASAQAQNPPPAVTACSMSGFSIASDRAGAAVRAEPNPKAKILGRLAPAQKATKVDNEDVPPSDGLWRTQFEIVGFTDGWFQIDKSLHPYDAPDRRGVLGRRCSGGVKTYAGRGWLPINQVGGKYTYYHRSMPAGALYGEPDEKAARLPALNGRGDPIQGGNQPNVVLGCQGEWVKVQSYDGVVGWWKGLCGQPIADCWKD